MAQATVQTGFYSVVGLLQQAQLRLTHKPDCALLSRAGGCDCGMALLSHQIENALADEHETRERTPGEDELRALTIEMRIFIIRHEVMMGECQAWRKLKERYGVARSEAEWEADLEWLRSYRNDIWVGRGLAPTRPRRRGKAEI